MSNQKFISLLVSFQNHVTRPMKVDYSMFETRGYEKAPWPVTIASALAFLLTPVVVPVLILLNRILKREIKFVTFSVNVEMDTPPPTDMPL